VLRQHLEKLGSQTPEERTILHFELCVLGTKGKNYRQAL
jgi:hypothetical protein